MKIAKWLSIASTIVCIFSVIIYSIFALVLAFGGTADTLAGFAGDSMSRLTSVDGNSPSAGFEVIAYLVGGAIGVLGIFFLLGLFALVVILILCQFPAIISGLVSIAFGLMRVDVKKRIMIYKIDGYLKAIMNGLGILLAIVTLAGSLKHLSLSDFFFWIVFSWNYVVVFVLSVAQIICISRKSPEAVSVSSPES